MARPLDNEEEVTAFWFLDQLSGRSIGRLPDDPNGVCERCAVVGWTWHLLDHQLCSEHYLMRRRVLAA